MKANTKITAGEIVALTLTPASKFKSIDEIFGKVRVRIAGIAGIVSANHIISIQKGTKEVEIIIGQEKSTVKLDGDYEVKTQSEAAKAALKAEGAKVTEDQEAKAIPAAETPSEGTSEGQEKPSAPKEG